MITAPALRFLGPVAFRATPIAVLTPRGTIRTRRKPVNHGQVYPPLSPADWIAEGHVTASVTCIACMEHRIDVRLDSLPALPWRQIGPRMICEVCGEPGAVNIKPNWHDHAPAFDTFKTSHKRKKPRHP